MNILIKQYLLPETSDCEKQPWRELSGKLKLLSRCINILGLHKSRPPLTLDYIMPRVVVFLQHPNNYVRSSAINVCMSCYKFSGSSIEPYFSTLRPALKELLHAGFLEVEDEKRRENKLPTSSPKGRPNIMWEDTMGMDQFDANPEDSRLYTPDSLEKAPTILSRSASVYVVKSGQDIQGGEGEVQKDKDSKTIKTVSPIKEGEGLGVPDDGVTATIADESAMGSTEKLPSENNRHKENQPSDIPVDSKPIIDVAASEPARKDDKNVAESEDAGKDDKNDQGADSKKCVIS